MITVGYLLFGVILCGAVLGYFWCRVPERHHGRLVLMSAAVVVAWPGVLILALADRKLTTFDYLNQWLAIDEDSDE